MGKRRYRVAASSARRRRGAVLLVVMMLLAVFTLACIALLMAASHSRRNALAAAHLEQTDDPPSNLVQRVFRQVVRGPRNPRSVIGAHSLLEDLYGAGETVTGHIASTVVLDPVTGVPQPGDPVDGFVPGDPRYAFPTPPAGALMFYVDVNAWGPDRQPGRANFDDDNNGTVDDLSEFGWPGSDDLHPTSGYYNGRVWTMVDGPLANQSTRITGYMVNLNQPPQNFSPPLAQGMARFRLLVIEGMRIDPNTAGWDPARAPRPGDRFVINGRPFNGSGFGYNAASGNLDAMDTFLTQAGPMQAPFGLLPNQTTPTYRAYSRIHGIHADEDYDAPDYQNMMLAGREWNGSRWVATHPSLHRPDLVAYWMNQMGVPPQQPGQPSPFNTLPYELQRRIMLRPLDVEHFMDVNQNGIFDQGVDVPFAGRDFDPVNGPWDVDNDGDGLPDSIWVDVGLGVMRDRNGRLYKPLAAILCLDLDGRLNLNAHGNANQYLPDPAAGPPTPLPTSARYITGKPPRQVPAYVGGMFTNANVRLPFGLGSGPADVNLAALLTPPYIDSATGRVVNEYQQLLEGRPAVAGLYPTPLAGRWGEAHLLALGRQPRAGLTTTGSPISPGPDGQFGTSDDLYTGDDNRPVPMVRFLAGGSPEQFEGNLYEEGFFPLLSVGVKGTPGDIGGTGSIALDLRGQPYWEDADYYGTPVNPNPGTLQHAIDDPYEIDLTLARAARPDYGPDGVPNTGDEAAGATVAADSPFTPAELEYLLRRGDRDSRSLPARIEDLAPTLVADPRRRGLVTTESWDLPCPAITPTPELRGKMMSMGISPVNLHLTDLVRARLLDNGFSGDINAELAKLLSPELVMGLRMNLNRPFGNGIDDNNNGVVDEPIENLLQHPATGQGQPGQPLWQNGPYGPIAFDANNDGLLDANDLLARHLCARHLFVLLMTLKDSGYELPVMDGNLSGTPEARELSARRIAQWCVNVVDFMDRDSIMTPFEYDVNPFNGWTVDGVVGVNPAGPDGIYGTADDDPNYTDDNTLTNPDRRLVWGLEYPDLLLTETVAWHDRHVRDLKFVESANGQNNQLRDEGNDGTEDDNDLDQYRVPEGVALFELYCTRNPNNPALVGDLYLPDGRLDLGRTAPDGRPVWRLAISRSRFSNPRNDVAQRCQQAPDIVSLQPDQFSLLPTLGPQARREPVELERFVWLAPVAPPQGAPEDGRTYYNRSGPVTLGPGEYCVIGPRAAMQIGWSDQNQGEPPPQQVGLNPMNVTNNSPTVPYSYPTIGTDIKPPITIVAAADIPAGQQANYDANFQQVGVSVSEPLPGSYYPVPPGSLLQAPGTLRADCFFDVDPLTNQVSPASNPGAPVLDQPFDSMANMPFRELRDNGFAGTGTVLQYRTVFLQRLADPTLPWNPEPFNWDGSPNIQYNSNLPVNPYLTIDWMFIDLTVFNGDDQRPTNSMLPQWDPDDPAQEQNPREDPNNPIRFATRQRGFPRTPPAVGSTYNIWQQPAMQALTLAIDPTTPPRLNVVGQDDFTNPMQTTWNFEHNLAQTLGYINRPFQELTAAQAPNERWYTQAYVNNPANQSLYPNGYDANYLGDPVRPMPWLAWNNRPFLSPMELLLVPTSAPARLQHELGTRIQNFSDHYADMQPNGAAGPPFSHLLNFFHSANTNAPDAGNFYRLLEYVHVPSRFSGGEDVLNPALLQGPAAGPHEFHPPYNRISRYREPGKINLNTVLGGDDTLWRALMNMRQDYSNDPLWSSSQFWQAVAATRLGGPGPAILGNPFRSFNNAYSVPPGAYRTDYLVQGTFMRAHPADSTRPLFAADSILAVPPANDPYPLAARQYDYNNTNRNPYFRYEAYFKLGNTLTTRSNVYAIWITVGYFEVERVPITDPTNTPPDVPHYPDGFRIVRELGSETGEIRRHRGFFIFDRSIPVGFQRGEDLNIQRAVLVERILE